MTTACNDEGPNSYDKNNKIPRKHELPSLSRIGCPLEESAAMAAKHLKQAGFKKIRPLLGGIDAWVQAGQPVERALPSASTATS